ncbi:hypothetical protein USDA257_c25800 [Sinorhizobium fredii USDA 257]|uniref:Uncharacterized protein n=1 Tax=Sinorhizobium fredii (strain USDA 257) TaxID=1185652 RepID=I3X5J9_SINF2|nr:hypothetical protein USDA257_c25800 [Sinorhizobium fredii USDA 257]
MTGARCARFLSSASSRSSLFLSSTCRHEYLCRLRVDKVKRKNYIVEGAVFWPYGFSIGESEPSV